MKRPAVVFGLILSFALIVVSSTADANWLSRLARGASEIGGTSHVATRSLGALDNAAVLLKRLPASADNAAVAAHVTPEGHWQFVNREGAVFTAGTTDELTRALPQLVPEAASSGKVHIYLSEDTVFARAHEIAALPEPAAFHVVHGTVSYPVRITGPRTAVKISTQVKPNLELAISDRQLFDEAVSYLSRPLNRSNIRTISFEAGGPKSLTSAPKFDGASKAAQADLIDPGQLTTSLRSLSGQTALITGRIDGDLLRVYPKNGSEQTLRISSLTRAAEDADVNLVILDSTSGRQPGARNWLWLKYEVAGLDDALTRASFGDFLDALAAKHGAMTITAAEQGSSRIILRVTPTGIEPGATGGVSEMIGHWTGEIIGNVPARAIEIHARDEDRQNELDLRLIPGISSAIQFTYLGLLICGLIAYAYSSRWFASLWPPPQTVAYGSMLSFRWAQVGRWLVMIFLFFPIAGIPALLTMSAVSMWELITAPFRFLAWLARKFRRSPAAL